MGRTIPSFTMALIEEIVGWKPFRDGLDKADRKAFDDMTDLPHLYRYIMYVFGKSDSDSPYIHVRYFPSL